MNNIDIFKVEEKEDILSLKNKRKKSYMIKFLRKYLDSKLLTITLFLITIFALFGDDIKVLFFKKNADLIFDALILVSMSFYFTKIIASIFARDHYMFSFFFFLDIISSMSLILDISFIGTIPFLE